MGSRFCIVFALLGLLNISALTAQNLEKVGKKDMLTVGGGFNYNGIFYNANGISNRRPPYSWFFNSNLTFNFLDVSLPFTYSYSNLSSSYTQPFNMAGCAPTYKWIKSYLGYTSMNFSSYTLAGHVFLGAGVELTPGNWKFSAMYGRLKKAVEYDAVNETDQSMSFRRMGYGAKVGYEKSGYGFNLIWFSAKDELSSLKFIPLNTTVLPQENTVVSVSGKTRITRLFTLDAEYALSGLTRNLAAIGEVGDAQKNQLPYIFRMNTSSEFYSAYKSSLGFAKGIFSLGLNYEHIAPNYKTLGAYYFNNDLENITLNPAIRLLNGKLTIAANAGYQHNNLDRSKFSTNSRMVSSANLAFAPSPKFTCNAQYSNFTTYTNVRPLTDPYYQKTAADTLNFYQVSQNANAAMTYNKTGKALRHTYVLTGSYQVAAQKQGTVQQAPATVVNGNFCYNLGLVKSKWTAGLTYNYNRMNNLAGNTIYMGPGVTLGKGFLSNQMRFTLSNIFNQAYANGKTTALVLSERASLTYTPKVDKKFGKPSVSFSAMYTDKFKTEMQQSDFQEFTGMVNLSYNF